MGIKLFFCNLSKFRIKSNLISYYFIIVLLNIVLFYYNSLDVNKSININTTGDYIYIQVHNCVCVSERAILRWHLLQFWRLRSFTVGPLWAEDKKNEGYRLKNVVQKIHVSLNREDQKHQGQEMVHFLTQSGCDREVLH